MSTFFEDIKVCRPTSMMIIPRIANMLFDQAQEMIRKAKDEDKQVGAALFLLGSPFAIVYIYRAL